MAAVSVAPTPAMASFQPSPFNGLGVFAPRNFEEEMNRFEALCGLLNASGGFEPLEAAYLRQWLHTDQKVVLEEGDAKTEVTVRGLTKSGYLLADDAAGARFELHPDGNSFDFFRGLVRKKLH